MERDNNLEAKRLAQRNASSYVFGSSTNPKMDYLGHDHGHGLALDLPTLGPNLYLSTPNRTPTQTDDNCRRRPVSAYYSEDLNISLPDNTTETSCSLTSHNPKDCYKYRNGLNSEQTRACLTMSDPKGSDIYPMNGTISSAVDENMMSQSLVSLHGVFRGRRRHPELSPAMPRERIFASSTDRINKETNKVQTNDSVKTTPKRAVSMTRLDQLAQPRRRYLEETIKSKNNLNEKSKSMVHLLARPPPPPPRQTKSSKLRNQNMTLRNTRSSLSLNTDSLSPTRPISSMSSSTDGSVMEVKHRVKPAVPRKPRPLSIGSPYAVKQKVEDKDVSAARDSRPHDKTHSTTPMRPNRTRSVGGTPRPLSLVSPDSDSTVTLKPTPPRKPAHVKAAALARKAIKQSTSDMSLSDKTYGNIKSIKPKPIAAVVPEKQSEETPVPSVEPNSAERSPSESPNPDNCDIDMPSNAFNKRELSEEDYKKMMAEKRRLAREQAEREAEAERLTIEKQKQEEEERIKREEEEQIKLEEEQIRLIAIQRQVEEERLQKAMEDNRLREEEENKRKAEEQRQRLEREEKERKAKEEAEKQRIELEERLKRDEEERLQRKKKLEAIMSRTRKAPAVRGSSPTASPNETPEPQLTDHSNSSTPEKMREVSKNHQNMLKNEQMGGDLVIFKTNASDISNSVANNNPKPDLVEDVNRAVLQNRKSDQSNGVSTHNGSHLNNNNNIHIQNFRTDQRLENNLLDINSMSAVSSGAGREGNQSLDQLINLNYSTPTDMEDVFNSNHVTSNAFISTNVSNIKSQEQTITDLLS